jgi:hypothetical protein
MSCVVSPAKCPTMSAARCLSVLLFGAVVVGTTTGEAHANDPGATPAPSWCVARGDAQPECVYDNLVTCGLNAMLTGGACVKVEWSAPPTTTAAVVPTRPRRKPPPAPRKQTTAQQHDKLFREFERWKETAK